jgi:hypothetical protein
MTNFNLAKCALCGEYFEDGQEVRSVVITNVYILGLEESALGMPKEIEEITHIYCRGSVN